VATGYDEAACIALSLAASSLRSATAIAGSLCSSLVKPAWPIARQTTGHFATTVAERAALSRSAISPKKLPMPSESSGSPDRLTATSPSRTT